VAGRGRQVTGDEGEEGRKREGGKGRADRESERQGDEERRENEMSIASLQMFRMVHMKKSRRHSVAL